jgi:hypothetical protein
LIKFYFGTLFHFEVPGGALKHDAQLDTSDQGLLDTKGHTQMCITAYRRTVLKLRIFLFEPDYFIVILCLQ